MKNIRRQTTPCVVRARIYSVHLRFRSVLFDSAHGPTRPTKSASQHFISAHLRAACSHRSEELTLKLYRHRTKSLKSLRLAKAAGWSQPEFRALSLIRASFLFFFCSHFVPSCIKKGKRKALPPEGAGLPNCYRAWMFAKRLDGRCCGTRGWDKPRIQRERGIGALPAEPQVTARTSTTSLTPGLAGQPADCSRGPRSTTDAAVRAARAHLTGAHRLSEASAVTDPPSRVHNRQEH